jgi:hypothetical protein
MKFADMPAAHDHAFSAAAAAVITAAAVCQVLHEVHRHACCT